MTTLILFKSSCGSKEASDCKEAIAKKHLIESSDWHVLWFGFKSANLSWYWFDYIKVCFLAVWRNDRWSIFVLISFRMANSRFPCQSLIVVFCDRKLLACRGFIMFHLCFHCGSDDHFLSFWTHAWRCLMLPWLPQFWIFKEEIGVWFGNCLKLSSTV